MKKIIVVFMVLLMCISATGCSTGTQTDTPPAATQTGNLTGTQEDTPPRVQEIAAFLDGIQPYYRAMTNINGGKYLIMNYTLALGDEALIEQYMAVLIANDYDISLADIYTNRKENVTYTYYYLKYDGDSEKHFGRSDMDYHIGVTIATYEATATAEITFGYADGFEHVDDGHRADFSKVELKAAPSPSPSPSPTPAPTTKPITASETVNRNAAPIPEFSLFMNRNPSEDKDRYYGGNRKYYQKIPLETQQTVVAEILALLDRDRYQLELIEKVEVSDRIEYNYRYTGNVAMDSIHSKNDDSRYYNLQFTVYNRTNKNGTYGIHFHYSPQFVEENVGYTVSENTGGSSGGGGTVPDFEGGDLPDAAKLECLTCHGDGDCNSCDGKGYKIKDDIKSDCTRCTGGNCPACGGSGTRS